MWIMKWFIAREEKWMRSEVWNSRKTFFFHEEKVSGDKLKRISSKIVEIEHQVVLPSLITFPISISSPWILDYYYMWRCLFVIYLYHNNLQVLLMCKINFNQDMQCKQAWFQDTICTFRFDIKLQVMETGENAAQGWIVNPLREVDGRHYWLNQYFANSF